MKANEIFVRNADVSTVHYLLHFLELLGRAVRGFGAGNEEFDGGFQGRGDLEGLVGVREPFSCHPILEGSEADARCICNPFLGSVLFLYELFYVRPEYFHGFHASSIPEKYRQMALISLDYNAIWRYNLSKDNVK